MKMEISFFLKSEESGYFGRFKFSGWKYDAVIDFSTGIPVVLPENEFAPSGIPVGLKNLFSVF